MPILWERTLLYFYCRGKKEMKALYRNHILQAEITEVRGPNLLLTNGSLTDQAGAISIFSRLLILAREIEILEATDSENDLIAQALNYQEPAPPSRPESLRTFKVYFKKPELPRTSQIIEYQVFEMNPFTPSKERTQEVIEVGEDYLITKGANEPVKALVIYAVRGRPYRKNLEIVSIEVI
jgi:hypothetical protein